MSAAPFKVNIDNQLYDLSQGIPEAIVDKSGEDVIELINESEFADETIDAEFSNLSPAEITKKYQQIQEFMDATNLDETDIDDLSQNGYELDDLFNQQDDLGIYSSLETWYSWLLDATGLHLENPEAHRILKHVDPEAVFNDYYEDSTTGLLPLSSGKIIDIAAD